jgi:hypothetical protein
MPAKSKAQQKFLFAAAARGEVPQSVAEDFAVKGKAFKKLPQSVRTKKASHHATDGKRSHSDD